MMTALLLGPSGVRRARWRSSGGYVWTGSADLAAAPEPRSGPTGRRVARKCHGDRVRASRRRHRSGTAARGQRGSVPRRRRARALHGHRRRRRPGGRRQGRRHGACSHAAGAARTRDRDRSRDRVREAIAIANNEIHRLASTAARVGRHGLRAHRRGRARRPGDDRPRRRYAALQAAARARSRRSRAITRRSASARMRTSCPSATRCGTRAATRSTATSARSRTNPTTPEFVDVQEISVRARRGAAALQRRPDRPGRLGVDRPDRPAVWPAEPQAVVAALIAAANDAGGKDNVTVVYVEHEQFPAAPRAGSAGRRRTAATRGNHPPPRHLRRPRHDAPAHRPHGQHRAPRGRDRADARAFGYGRAAAAAG